MAYGPIYGGRYGAVWGSKYGSLTLGSGVTVVTDPTSNKGVPLSQAEWNDVFTVAGVGAKTVHSSWGFQDASGNIAATVGTALTVTGTLDYRQAVAGWTRLSANFTETAAERAGWAAGVGPNPASVSTLWIAYIDLTLTPAASRNFLGCSVTGAPASTLVLTNTPRFRVTTNGVSGTGTVDPVTGGVRPFVILNDRTGSRSLGYSDQEKLSTTYAALGDGHKGFNTTGTGAQMSVLWGAHFESAHAEWSDAEVKAILQALGWTIPWS